MAFKMELRKGGELHFRSRRQKSFFIGLLIVVCILYAVGGFSDISFFERTEVLFSLMWVLCLPLIFNGAVCEACTEGTPQKEKYHRSYYVSFIAAFGIPLIGSVIAVVTTGVMAYLLIFFVAAFFALRNHQLYLAL